MVASARDRRRRIVGHNEPSRWHPGTVLSPRSELPMSSSDAWELIATKLEEEHEVEVVELRQPPQRTGYVMKVQLSRAKPLVYVKVQFENNKIIGRSFHYSDYE